MANGLCQQLHTATRDWLQRAAPLLRGHGRAEPAIEVRCNLRGKSAGQVRHQADGSLLIRYNLGIASLQPEAFLEQTVPHEVAHVVTWLLHGSRAKPHGREWREVMAFFGRATAARCHDFQIPTDQQRRQRRWHYACDCREHQLSTTRHRRIQQGGQYQCRLCGSLLRPAGA